MANVFRLGTFGGLWLERDRQRVEGTGLRRLGLLAAVAAAGERGITRDRLLLLLWPDSTEAKARHALAQALHATRRDLGPDIIRPGPTTLLIDPAHLTTDFGEFQEAIAAGEPERAVALYGGPFLDGYYIPEADEFERWAEVERARLRELAMEAFEAAARRATEAGRLQDATGYWRRLNLLTPHNSRIAVALITALAESGDAGGAIQLGRGHDQLCRQELGLPPDPSVGALLTHLTRGEWRSSRPGPATAAQPDQPVPSAPPTGQATMTEPDLPVQEAVDRTAPIPEPPPQKPSRPRTAAIGAAVLVVLAVWLVPKFFAAKPGFPDGSLVVAADPVDLTGTPGLGRGLASAASVGLQQSRHLSLLSRSRINAALGRMGRSGDSLLTDSLALEVAAREHARAVFALTVNKVGHTYSLVGRLLSPTDGSDMAVHTVSVQLTDDLLPGLDRLIRRVLATAGDSRPARDSLPALPLVTTRSLEALKLYAEGAESARRTNYDRATELYLRAVAIDTEFALAHVALGAAQYLNRDRPAGDRHYAMAQRFRNRLTFREQMLLDSRLATARGNLEAASRIDLVLAERYPSRQTWYNYGTGLLQMGRCPLAIPALRRALTFDSSSALTHINLATCYKILGENRIALDEYAAAERADSSVLVSLNINHEWGGLFVRLGRYAEAEAAFRRMLGRASQADQARGRRSLAYLAMFQGRYREAIDHLTTAVTLTSSPETYQLRLRNEVNLSEAFLMRGSPRQASQELDSALKGTSQRYVEPGLLALLGRGLVRAGRTADARKVLARIDAAAKPENTTDRSARALLTAELALARKAPVEAFDAIRRDVDPTFQEWRTELLGRSLAGRGILDSALTVTAAFANQQLFGFEAQRDWVLAPMQIALLAEKLGDRGTAVSALQSLLERWRNADPDLPALLEVRRRLERLQRESRTDR